MIKNILCKLGFHDWLYNNTTVSENIEDNSNNHGTFMDYKCSHCGKEKTFFHPFN